MFYKTIKYLLPVLFFANVISVKSQQNNSGGIQVVARALPDKIIIRWAPTSPMLWQKVNKQGYIVERILMSKKGRLVKDRQLVRLTAKPVKPWPEEKWAKYFADSLNKKNNYAVIAAQAMLGESFTITEDYSNDVYKAITKSEENERRFTFALFAADQSLIVAKAMGLLYVDDNIKKDEKYLYRIFPGSPHGEISGDTAFVYIGASDHASLPHPFDFNAYIHQDQVNLTWNRELFEKVYSSYQLERSENGTDFYAMDNLPFINTSPEKNKFPELMYRVDSLPANNSSWYYRVRGRTIFEEYGPWSDTLEVKSAQPLIVSPVIEETEVIENSIVKVKWSIPEGAQNVSYINVLRSNNANGGYQPIAENLNPEQKFFIDKSPLPVNYYVINALDNNGQSKTSFTAMVQLVDSFPPLKPLKPEVEIDTLGNVTVSWIKGKEPDILGYRIFRSNFLNSEFGQVSKNTIVDTVYYEKIGLDNLSKKIYYKIAAIDKNFNQSELSEAFLAQKPDMIAPVAPLFKPPLSTKEGVVLFWINSSSNDVVKNVLYHRLHGSKTWTTVGVFHVKDSINEFTDKEIEIRHLYEYTMIAVDSSANESLPGKSVFARKLDSGIRPLIDKIGIKADFRNKQIILSWEYPYHDIEHFLLYRAENDASTRYYQIISKDKENYQDKKISLNTFYRYRLKAVFTDGSESAFSKEISVKF